MLQKPQSCYQPLRVISSDLPSEGCKLANIGKGFSYPEGTCSNGVLLVGEALGHHEALEGFPFRPHAPAGSLLTRAIQHIGQTRQQFGIYNTIACQPPNNELVGAPYEQDAINHCAQHLRKVYEHFGAPPVIVALGAVATRALTGLSGERLSLDMLRGFPLSPDGSTAIYLKSKTLIVPTYHPAYILRGNQALFMTLMADLAFALTLASEIRQGTYQIPKTEYSLHANTFSLRAFHKHLKTNPSLPISFDFETAVKPDTEFDEETGFHEQQITQVNFSIAKNTAVVTDFDASTSPLIQDILALPNIKIGYNSWHFDERVANHNGLEILGEHMDAMWSFHHIYPDLPGSYGKSDADGDEDGALAPLQFCAACYRFPLPWKHLFKLDPHLYGAYDADATLYVAEGVMRDLHRLDLVSSHNEYVHQLRKELKAMEKRGMPASPDKLLALSNSLAASLEESEKKIQILVPEDLLSPHPAYGYAKPPKALIKALADIPQHIPDDQKTAIISEKAQQLKLVWRPFQVQKRMCVCVEKKFTGDPSKGCLLCDGTGNRKGAAKAVKCECRSWPVSDCEMCFGTGFRFKKPDSYMSCITEGFHSFAMETNEKKVLFCSTCGWMPQGTKSCPCVKAPLVNCLICGGSGKVKEYAEKPCKCRQRAHANPSCQHCYGTGLFTGTIYRWASLRPFNVNSSKQMLAYATAKGYQIPINSKRQRSMDKETINKLARKTGDPLFIATVEHREMTKIKGAYADGWLKRLKRPQ